ncbi:MAG TPA: type IV toxin-antitoxin system AbiEi family antitoxin domain-containing protein [Intrasporangium sp.]|uniref:type IV toxin-antitoxin system AbiEi family antitoxin domain-containing protein n=1 Tax=Intrasporangium sp. TaxID=1925024 RepID=UPI002D78074D|nr:type IV toxin-antitoxin system AbiEi family antitoxin domain-containing protein [Intrasporangium sp.]HET7398235.1 type IV toxin-antitoxin system AbiEi family antitoxin domain-containing protein [Intrasporangium sp.]
MDLNLLGTNGVFSAADAHAHGLDSHALDRLLRSGACIRLTRGWYARSDGPVDDTTRHARAATALGLQFGHRAAVSHHSLLIVRGLPTYRADLATVHLTSTLPTAPTDVGVAARRPGLVIHRPVAGLVRAPLSGSAGGRAAPAGMPLAHAIVQAGLLSGPESTLVPADAALCRGLVDPAGLLAAASSLAGRRGIGPVRAALAQADGRHESPGETRTAYLLHALGYQLDPQVELVAEGRRFRADLRIRGTRVLVEFDGAVKYAGGDGRALFEEKRREDALRREGWVVVRLVWADLDDPPLVRARIERALRLVA